MKKNAEFLHESLQENFRVAMKGCLETIESIKKHTDNLKIEVIPGTGKTTWRSKLKSGESGKTRKARKTDDTKEVGKTEKTDTIKVTLSLSHLNKHIEKTFNLTHNGMKRALALLTLWWEAPLMREAEQVLAG